jgi:hypothetical protein
MLGTEWKKEQNLLPLVVKPEGVGNLYPANTSHEGVSENNPTFNVKAFRRW